MALPSNGITADVIRDVMPPYRLDPDLMASTVAALPPPPQDTTTAWRQAHLTRLLGEIAALKPADAAQARIASHLLIVRELVDTFSARTHAAAPDIAQMCRLSRTTTELLRSANALERTLERHQQKPVPFYGTVVQDEVDIPDLATLWGGGIPASAGAGSQASARAGALAASAAGITHPPAAPAPDTLKPATGRPRPRAVVPGVDSGTPQPAAAPTPAPDARPTRHTTTPPNPPDAAPHAADTEPRPAGRPRSPDRTPPEPAAPQNRSSDPSPHPVRAAGTSPDWVIGQLDQGPGWSREVLRPRTAADPAACPGEGRDHGAVPRSVAR